MKNLAYAGRAESSDARAVRSAGAMHMAEAAARWFAYSTWHPDFDTLNFIQAYQDYKAEVPIETVYEARGLEMPRVNALGQDWPR